MVWRKLEVNNESKRTTTIFRNARVTTGVPGEEGRKADCVVIEGATISHIGSEHDIQVIQAAQSPEAQIIDLQGQRLLPSFFDGHVHLLQFGISLAKIDLRQCESFPAVKKAIKEGLEEHPQAQRLLFHGWRRAITGHDVTAAILDAITDGRPVFIDSDDLHACWCNNAALTEIGADTAPNPPGGRIVRDEDGKPTGIIEEAAVIVLVWGFIIGAMSVEKKKAAITRAVLTYNAAGYTSVVDMAMDEDCWTILSEMHDNGELPLRIAAHFIILPSPWDEENLAQVDRVIELHQRFNLASSPNLRITGIKIICDGVVDGCTAALSHPYLKTGETVLPIWTPEALKPVLHRAHAANLQCALHAIGDAAVSLAVRTLSTLPRQPDAPSPRHRIEHLELTSPADAKRLGDLGVTASVQPVHCDPELNTTWPPLIGHEACKRAFAYGEFLSHGAKLAFGTDTPTAPHVAFDNLYNATTRRSFRRPKDTETVNEHFKIALHEAICSVSYWPAWACFAEGMTGGLRVGKSADLIVVDSQGDWIEEPTSILQSKVTQTWLGGNKVF